MKAVIWSLIVNVIYSQSLVASELQNNLKYSLELFSSINNKSSGLECSPTEVNMSVALNQCAIDLCGKPNPALNAFLRDENAEKYVDAEKLKIITENEEKLKIILEKHRSNIKEQLNYIKKNKDNLKIPDPSKTRYWYELSNKSKEVLLEQFNSNVDLFMTKMENEIDKPDNFNNVLKTCRKYLYLYGMKKVEEKNVKKLYHSTQKDFLSRVINKIMSKDSQKAIKQHMSTKVDIFSREIEGFESTIDQINDFYAKSSSSLNEDELISGVNNYIILIIMGNDNFIRGNDNFNPLADFPICPGEGTPISLLDSFSVMLPPQTKDQLNVSLYSCLHKKQGRNTLAHEMGHLISYYFLSNKNSEDYKTYLKIRECASSQNIENVISMSNMHHENDNYKTEEDTADLLSFMFSKNDKLLGECIFLEPSEDYSKYNNLIINGYNISGHSSNIFRLINEAYQKNRPIPPSCQALIDPTKFQFKKCI